MPVLDWTDCGGGFQCATAAVPVDHSRPRGATLDLALIRRPAADPANRIGTLFANPGGPGVSGVDFVRTAPPPALAIATRRFDLVGWDPRGVGASGQLDCGPVDFPAALPRPGQTDEAAWVRAGRDFGRGCRDRNRALLPHLSTADTARDLDLLRQAVGDDRLSYFGISYGTLIGATYASLFPGRARVLLLDAAVDPEVYLHRPLEARQEQVSAFERGLSRFFTACARDQVACAGFGGADPEAAFDALVARADAAPVPAPDAPGAEPLTGDDILDVAEDVVYRKASWPFFARGLAQAQAGDGSLLQLANQPSPGFSGDLSVVTRALDQDYPRQPRPFLTTGRFAGRAFPHFGWLSGYLELPFGLLPVEAANPYRGAFRNPASAPPVLVIGTAYDTATPYVWAQRLTAQLGNARLLTYQGDGHAALTDLNLCIVQHGFRYLEEGVLPAAGSSCQQTTPFVQPAAGQRSATRPGAGWETGERLR
ncbi:MAG TPA: alpha/beta hydrolase [Mycobacteriales bacterium]|nr:alpha/beta hydrolase [Mycobacteriales bacterium]